MAEPQSVTALLQAWRQGDESALERLVQRVDRELRRVARRRMALEAPGHTLQTTALINEAYVRLVQGSPVPWQNRAHFFALAARLMRHILVDHARAGRNLKRGRGFERVSLNDRTVPPAMPARGIVALDDALGVLAERDPRRSRVVELRFFGGLTVEETADVLNVSPQTVMRDWKLARAWLRRAVRRMEP